MPSMDGFEVARRMQTTKSRSTLVMMLSSAGGRRRCRSGELGITMTLVKPIGPSDLPARSARS
jgi:DNA-binding response OmpR family regulator